MGNSQFEISKYVPEKLDVGRWMLDVRASARHGPVAQRLEQGTHNPLVPGSNPGGPSLRFGAQRRSEGCHAVTKWRRAGVISNNACLNTIEATVRIPRSTGRGESKPLLRSNLKAKHARSRNI